MGKMKFHCQYHHAPKTTCRRVMTPFIEEKLWLVVFVDEAHQKAFLRLSFGF